MIDVIFYEAFEEEQKLLKENLPANIKAEYTSKTIQEYGKIPQTKIVSIRTQSRIPSDFSAEAILTRSQGYDHLFRYRQETQTQLPMGYLGNYCDEAVAEQAFLILIALTRNLKAQIKSFETFNRDGLTGASPQKRRVLVVGVGNIGSKIVNFVKRLSIPVKGVDLVKRLKDIQYVSLVDGVKWADVIFCALPLTKDTDKMLSYDVLKNAQPGLILINVSRGEVSPIEDLDKLFEEGILTGLGLDIYEQESALAECLRGETKEKNNAVDLILKLKDRDDCIFTPHNAFNTFEAIAKKAKLSAEAVTTFLKANRFPTPVPKI